MDGNGTTAEPHSVEQLILAGIGWLSLTAEAIDDIADDLARSVGVERARMRGAVRDVFASWRREGEKIGSFPSEASDKALKRIGLVRREEADDLALRLAQLEHRVRLLERPEPVE
jgi:polyhydroxyalkanoate synthesis regulator phasin